MASLLEKLDVSPPGFVCSSARNIAIFGLRTKWKSARFSIAILVAFKAGTVREEFRKEVVPETGKINADENTLYCMHSFLPLAG